MWTTGGHAADYVWLAVRTDPDAPKHKGISVLIVDTRDPGYSWTPIITADGSHHVNATYYQDVRVPADMLVGKENEGWRLITTQLNHERVMLAPAGRFEGLRDLVRDWAAKRTAPDGRPVLEQAGRARPARPGDRDVPGQRAAQLADLAVGGQRRARGRGRLGEQGVRLRAAAAGRPAGRGGGPPLRRRGRRRDRRAALYLDSQAKRYLVLTFGGGVNEVQRELVCMFGLGLPRVPR